MARALGTGDQFKGEDLNLRTGEKELGEAYDALSRVRATSLGGTVELRDKSNGAALIRLFNFRDHTKTRGAERFSERWFYSKPLT